jgi:hypothetical protein
VTFGRVVALDDLEQRFLDELRNAPTRCLITSVRTSGPVWGRTNVLGYESGATVGVSKSLRMLYRFADRPKSGGVTPIKTIESAQRVGYPGSLLITEESTSKIPPVDNEETKWLIRRAP